jgi:hypothetical protein
MIIGQAAVIKSAQEFAISEPCFMDVMIFLKLAPAMVGIAGLLTYFMMRARARTRSGTREDRATRSQHIFATRVRGVNHAKRVANPQACATGSRYLLSGLAVGHWKRLELRRIVPPLLFAAAHGEDYFGAFRTSQTAILLYVTKGVLASISIQSINRRVLLSPLSLGAFFRHSNLFARPHNPAAAKMLSRAVRRLGT